MRVLIADNHTLFREGFRSQLQRFDALGELQEVTNYEALTPLSARNIPFNLVFIDRDLLGKEWQRESPFRIHHVPDGPHCDAE